MMNKKEKARYSVIVQELARLSANGWERALVSDYAPLEAELSTLMAKKG